MEALSLPYMPFPSLICLTTAEAGRCNEDGASVPAETPDDIMTLVSYFWSPQVFPERHVYIKRYRQGNSRQSRNLPKQCDITFADAAR